LTTTTTTIVMVWAGRPSIGGSIVHLGLSVLSKALDILVSLLDKIVSVGLEEIEPSRPFSVLEVMRTYFYYSGIRVCVPTISPSIYVLSHLLRMMLQVLFLSDPACTLPHSISIYRCGRMIFPDKICFLALSFLGNKKVIGSRLLLIIVAHRTCLLLLLPVSTAAPVRGSAPALQDFLPQILLILLLIMMYQRSTLFVNLLKELLYTSLLLPIYLLSYPLPFLIIRSQHHSRLILLVLWPLLLSLALRPSIGAAVL
jgi:hypothetical protein